MDWPNGYSCTSLAVAVAKDAPPFCQFSPISWPSHELQVESVPIPARRQFENSGNEVVIAVHGAMFEVEEAVKLNTVVEAVQAIENASETCLGMCANEEFH